MNPTVSHHQRDLSPRRLKVEKCEPESTSGRRVVKGHPTSWAEQIMIPQLSHLEYPHFRTLIRVFYNRQALLEKPVPVENKMKILERWKEFQKPSCTHTPTSNAMFCAEMLGDNWPAIAKIIVRVEKLDIQLHRVIKRNKPIDDVLIGSIPVRIFVPSLDVGPDAAVIIKHEVSPICPLGGNQIKTAVRFLSCKHHRCFDLENYLHLVGECEFQVLAFSPPVINPSPALNPALSIAKPNPTLSIKCPICGDKPSAIFDLCRDPDYEALCKLQVEVENVPVQAEIIAVD